MSVHSQRVSRSAFVFAFLVATAPALAGDPPPTFDAAPNKLSAADVEALFGRQHHEDGMHGKDAWSMDVSDDLSLAIHVGTFHDTGRGQFNGNFLCITWTKLFNGALNCFNYASLGDNRYASYTIGGKLDSIFVVAK